MSGSRTATAVAKEHRRNKARPRAACYFCTQTIKMFHPRMPVRRGGKDIVGWCHPGCGLRGSKNGDTARMRRQFAVGTPARNV